MNQEPKTNLSFTGGLVTLTMGIIVWTIKIMNSELDMVLIVLSAVCGLGLALTFYGAIKQPPQRSNDDLTPVGQTGLPGLQVGFWTGVAVAGIAVFATDIAKTVLTQVIANVFILLGVATALYSSIRQWRREY